VVLIDIPHSPPSTPFRRVATDRHLRRFQSDDHQLAPHRACDIALNETDRSEYVEIQHLADREPDG
jgi:hypothetical protein